MLIFRCFKAWSSGCPFEFVQHSRAKAVFWGSGPLGKFRMFDFRPAWASQFVWSNTVEALLWGRFIKIRLSPPIYRQYRVIFETVSLHVLWSVRRHIAAYHRDCFFQSPKIYIYHWFYRQSWRAGEPAQERPRGAQEAPRSAHERPGAPRSAKKGSGAPYLGWIGFEGDNNYDLHFRVRREITKQDALAG